MPVKHSTDVEAKNVAAGRTRRSRSSSPRRKVRTLHCENFPCNREAGCRVTPTRSNMNNTSYAVKRQSPSVTRPIMSKQEMWSSSPAARSTLIKILVKNRSSFCALSPTRKTTSRLWMRVVNAGLHIVLKI